MDLQFYGANCVSVGTKSARIVIDDNLSDLGAKNVTKAGDIALFTGLHAAPAVDTKLSIDIPGEYEVSDISIVGLPAQAHLDGSGQNATMYKITAGDITLLATGHIQPKLSDKQLEAIGLIDVLVIPVGGRGYTLDPIGALKLIKAIEPKLVIPTHYDDKALTFEVPQTDLATALHELGMEAHETVGKLRVKPAEFSDVTQLIVLDKS